MKLVFATQNQHKIKEINQILTNDISIIGLDSLGFFDEIAETQNTIEGNALQKAHFIWDKFHLPCFADDTGLEIDALNGQPGVYSARYAGENKSFDDNCNKVLSELEGKTNRKARFRTVIALIIDAKDYIFEGIIEGSIIHEKMGSDGFGYDPIFMPEGYDITFAQMPLDIKNAISHRGLATNKLVNFLKTYTFS
ncbi:MAG: non-canonical purine NTP diphosphatase [Bacteroidota bacterium]